MHNTIDNKKLFFFMHDANLTFQSLPYVETKILIFFLLLAIAHAFLSRYAAIVCCKSFLHGGELEDSNAFSILKIINSSSVIFVSQCTNEKQTTKINAEIFIFLLFISLKFYFFADKWNKLFLFYGWHSHLCGFHDPNCLTDRMRLNWESKNGNVNAVARTWLGCWTRWKKSNNKK